MKNILLLTDFSENAWNAIFMATKLHTDLECKFYLLNTYEPKTQNVAGFKSSSRAGVVYKSLSEASQAELAKAKEYLDTNHKNSKHSFEVLSVAGDLVETIEQLVSRYDLDAIVMGTKGSTAAKEIFMGSNAVKVLKKVKNCAILVVPEAFNFQKLQLVVFPTEYAHFYPKNVLCPLLQLFRQWKPQINVFHVAQEFKLSELQQANKEVLKKRFGDYPTSFHRVEIRTTVAEAIRQFTEEQKADMIVLTNHSHGFFEGLTQEPVVKKVSFRTQVPLLVLPDFDG
ncbi:universal stress protein [Flagellimonas nanhaiensis]|uniref:Universal stress protein n=1 Tax=Flagellimonas nanhaiensis TaxID=2292706 RepID=A0A371JLU2_9FLAO|nr:universal stress protein [Allomuricauda nanhaiensis]RDY58038.1 universal stress protein [Allomuricauda nanhaiensis]